MAKKIMTLPEMGEGIMEATVIKIHVKVGDVVEEDDIIMEVATDKIDSDVPALFSGKISEIHCAENEAVAIGSPVFTFKIKGDSSADEELVATPKVPQPQEKNPIEEKPQPEIEEIANQIETEITTNPIQTTQMVSASTEERFYSPLVRSIAQKENISLEELKQIKGSGKNDRLTKEDILQYVENTQSGSNTQITKPIEPASAPVAKIPVSVQKEDEVIPMDRMRKMIANHMVHSVQTAPHVTSIVEVDITHLVEWRTQNKENYIAKHGEKITYTPFFIYAVAKAIGEFPAINSSVDGDNIIQKKQVNIGMAAALPTGNLIVPVIKNANEYNLLGLCKQVNDLANRSRNNALKPEEIQGGTYTITNIGSFGNIIGTPIINQPQVAILAFGAIQKVPAVVTTEQGDEIGIRHKMYLSHSYDHRVVDGALGGMFVKKVADILEQLNPDII